MDVYLAIVAERQRAHLKHLEAGNSMELKRYDDALWLPVLTEEIGEVARAICDKESIERLREELIQVAAMASAWVDACSAALENGFEHDDNYGEL